jgi:hypothetical protein
MAVTQAKTLEDLRKAIGRNLGKMITGVTSGGGSSTTALDTKLFGGDDEYNGSYIRFTSGTNDGETARITDYTSSSGTMTFAAVTGTVTVGVGYELWNDGFNPDVIDEFINQSIWEVTGRVYDPVENLDTHTDRINTRWEIPSGLAMIQDVYYRDKVTQKLLHNCNSAFDDNVDDDFNITADTEDYKTGSASNKIVISVNATGGETASDTITTVDISKYDYLEFWIKSSVATSTTVSGNLKIHLIDADGIQESLDVPALTANVWKYCRVALVAPYDNTAITQVRFEYDSDLGACVVHLDDIKVVKNDTAAWEKLARNTWRIDKQGTTQGASTADLVLSDRGRALAGYRLLKIVGGNVPTEFSLDTTVTEVPERYVVAYATALAAQAGSTRSDIDTDGMRTLAGFWHNKASEARNALPFLTSVRTVR